MLDPHVHLRDWNQSKKETVQHGLLVAYKAGLDGVFEMPNTDPPLTSRDGILERIELGDEAIAELKKEYQDFEMFHGIYAGITPDVEQIKEVVAVYREQDRVVGLKMFDGNSTGNMGLIDDEKGFRDDKQRLVYTTLAKEGYEGVLDIHCEKESLLLPELFDINNPITHCAARPEIAENVSAQDQVVFGVETGYMGTLHLVHVSSPATLEYVEKIRPGLNFKITTEVSPHHSTLYDALMSLPDGILKKMNPPLRSIVSQKYMREALLRGRIDMIGTDHAPHTLQDKLGEKPASGIPGLPYYPIFVRDLIEEGAGSVLIDAITHNNIEDIFGVKIHNSQSYLKHSKQFFANLALEYPFNPYEKA